MYLSIYTSIYTSIYSCMYICMYIYIYVNPRALSTKKSRYFRFSQGRDGIIGQWVMTTKYLATLPADCKHQPQTYSSSYLVTAGHV